MIVYFCDSSVLAKLFVAEAGTEEMIRMVESTEDSARLSSALSVLEVRSGIRRRQHYGDIDHELAEEAIFDLDVESRRMVQLSITAPIIEEAARLVDRRRLRALDAIQLATAITARELQEAPDEFRFVCADQKLLAAAQEEGFAVWNPAG